jgi:hypothetical protein
MEVVAAADVAAWKKLEKVCCHDEEMVQYGRSQVREVVGANARIS